MESTTITELSEVTSLTPQMIRKYCRDGILQCEKIGNLWLIDKKSAENFIKEHNDEYKKDHEGKSMKTSSKPKVLSFFSGAMGMDIGLEKAGFEVRLACEVDKFCKKTILRNKPDIALIGDIRDYTADEIRKAADLSNGEEIDVIVGGPPCQAFSTAGKRQGFEDERGNVFLTFIDRIIELQPKFVVLENVRGLLSAPLKHRAHSARGFGYPPLTPEEDKGGALMHIVDKLRKAGYGVSFNLYNAANFGSPQKRERVVMLCSRDGEVLPFLTPTHSENGEFGLKKWKTFQQAVADLDPKEHEHLNFPEKRLKYYRLLQPGQYWKHLPVDLQKEALGNSFYAGGGKTGFLRRLAWDQPSPTLVTHPAMPATDLAHPEENRPLSIQEYKRIQEFPDDWIIEGPLVQKYKQIGNAVPSSLGKAIGELLNKCLAGEVLEVSENLKGFRFSRYHNTCNDTWEQQFKKRQEKASSLLPSDNALEETSCCR